MLLMSMLLACCCGDTCLTMCDGGTPNVRVTLGTYSPNLGGPPPGTTILACPAGTYVLPFNQEGIDTGTGQPFCLYYFGFDFTAVTPGLATQLVSISLYLTSPTTCRASISIYCKTQETLAIACPGHPPPCIYTRFTYFLSNPSFLRSAFCAGQEIAIGPHIIQRIAG